MSRVSLVLLAACSGGDDELEPSPAAFVDALDVEAVETYPSLGSIPFRATVRARNRFGAAVPSDPTDTLALDGFPVTAEFDGFGYGAVELATPGSFVLTGGEPDQVDLHAVNVEWPGFGLHGAWPSPTGAVTLGASTRGGMVAAVGTSVWWAGDGVPPHRVLEAESDILGLRRGHVDVDGILDAVAWTETTVFLLRGRAGGGMGWGGALAASGFTVAGAGVGDMSGDNLPDLAIAWDTGSSSGVLDIWEGDGLFGFTAAEPRTFTPRPISLALGDASSDERMQVTVLLEDRQWARFIQAAPRQYIPIGPLAPVEVLPEDAEILPGGDVQGDGGDDLVVVGPIVSGEPRTILTFDVLTDAEACADEVSGAQCNTEYLDIVGEVAAQVAVGDANGDGYADVVTQQEDGEVSVVFYDALADHEGAEAYRKLTLLDAIEAGPIDLLDQDDDGSADLHIVGPSTWFRWYGEGSEVLDEFWHRRVSPAVRVSSDTAAFWIVSSDPTEVELVAVRVADGSTELVLQRFLPADGSLEEVGSSEVDTGGAQPTDLVVCGRDAYVVVRGEVVRVQLDALGVADDRAGAAATRVDCGRGPSSSNVVFLDSGQAVLAQRDLGVLDTVDATGAQDVALGDAGGGAEVRTCGTAGCSIVYLPAPSGVGLFAVAEGATTVLVDGTGATTPLAGRGTLSVADVDGDGHFDLAALWKEAGVITVHRSTGEGLGPAEQWLSEAALTGAVGAANGDADGAPDLWFLDTAGGLSHSLAPSERGGPAVSAPIDR